jgi:nitronate monooxygenase
MTQVIAARVRAFLARRPGLKVPIIQAPMAGCGAVDLAAAVCRAGGVGSLPCAMLTAAEIRAQLDELQSLCRPTGTINLNFFAHTMPSARESAEGTARWIAATGRAVPPSPPNGGGGPKRLPFDASMCEALFSVERLAGAPPPAIVSFHFGLPHEQLLAPVRAAGCEIWATATTVAEARWLAARGCDAVVCQGFEAGGHRGTFLKVTDGGGDGLTNSSPAMAAHSSAPSAVVDAIDGPRVGTIALVPLVADALAGTGVTVIAAGGISDARGVAAALALGASAVQLGTAFLRTDESLAAPAHQAAVAASLDTSTEITNVPTGRAARGLLGAMGAGPEQGAFNAKAAINNPANAAALFGRVDPRVAPFPAQAAISGGTRPMWAGQAAGLAREGGAEAVTARLWAEAAALLGMSKP